jgi:hypothetical protein
VHDGIKKVRTFSIDFADYNDDFANSPLAYSQAGCASNKN